MYTKENHDTYKDKYGAKTANLCSIAYSKEAVPELIAFSHDEINNFLKKYDKGVIAKSWTAMKNKGKIEENDVNLKTIVSTIKAIFDNKECLFPFEKKLDDFGGVTTKKWVTEKMKKKVLIVRSTGDEDSADTPNAGGNESVLFVEPNLESLRTAIKEVVVSYYG